MYDQKPFSWLKAFGHALAITAVFFLPSLAFSIAGVVNAVKAGEFAGGFMIPAFILGWFWSYARQRGQSTVKYLLVAVLVAMSAYEVFVLGLAAATRDKAPAVSALEKHPPALYKSASGSLLCQQDVGLKVPLGDIELSPAPDLAEALRKKDPNDAVARWVYRAGAADILVLMAAKGFDSEESLHDFARGVSGAAEGRMTKVRDTVEWSGDHGAIVLSFRQGENGSFDTRCVSATNGDLACVQTIGSGPDRLAGLRDRLSFGSCE